MFKAENKTATDTALPTPNHAEKMDTNNPNGAEEEECWDDAKEDHDMQLMDNHPLLQASKNDGTMGANDNKTSSGLKAVIADASLSSSSSAFSSSQSANSVESVNLTLHEAVFNNDITRIYELLKQKDSVKHIINQKDKHGNTPLHLACMLGRSEGIVSALLQCGASVDTKNVNRWTPFHEACSYGNREVLRLLTKQLKDDVYDALNKHNLSDSLEKTKNYRLTLKWEFQSWIPFITRVLPSDVCVINKQGKYIRIDTRILDFETLWKRRDSCLVYSDKFEKKWIIMNNKKRKFQHLETPDFYRNIENKVDDFMATDIVDFELKSTDIYLTRSVCGWLWVDDKFERIGKYNAALYNFNNVFLVTRKRREHLTEQDLKRNKAAYKTAINLLKFGKTKVKDAPSQEGDEETNDVHTDNQDDSEEPVQHRESLPPPPPTSVTWTQYCESEPPGNFPTLGREQKCKTVTTAFKASVAVSEDFPITKNEFLNILSIVPLKLFRKLKEFIELRLPDGFPIRLDFPVFPFLSARITFEDFTFIDGPVDESLFSIPDDYEEDPDIFSLLSSGRGRNPTDSLNGM